MKTLTLTQGQVALVDDEDFERFGQFKWTASWQEDSEIFYAVRGVGPRKNRKTILLHRAIMGVIDRRIKVDHRNHDGLDCRRHNLRIATSSQNGANRKGLEAKNTSGIRGVSWHKAAGKWIAQIRVRGENIHLGLFTAKAKAAAAYAAANRQHFGEFGGRL